jgi:hypothetical protein
VSLSVRGHSITMNVRTSNHHTPRKARVVADALKRQRGDRMVFVIESQHAAMGGVDPGYRATMSIDDNHRPRRH